MPIWFQILVLVGTICPVGFSGLQESIQTAQISRTNPLPPLFLCSQEITNDTLTEEAVSLDDEDSKDQRSSDSLCAFLESGKAGSSINNNLPRAGVSWRITKHARIYLLCALLI
jgi:hypothetical protein